LIPDDSENGRSLDNLLDKTSRDRVVISLLSELEQTVVKSQSVCEKFEQNVANPFLAKVYLYITFTEEKSRPKLGLIL
jgi:hypothetical protein